MAAEFKIEQILIANTASRQALTLFRASNGRLYSTAVEVELGGLIALSNREAFDPVPISYVAGGVVQEILIERINPEDRPVERVLYAVFDPRKKTLSLEDESGFQRVEVSLGSGLDPYYSYDIKIVPRRVSGATIFDMERKYEVDFDGNAFIGEPVGTYYGAGLYLGKVSGHLYWSPEDEVIVEGDPLASTAVRLAVPRSVIAALGTHQKTQPADRKLKSRPIALDADKIENDVQIALPVYRPSTASLASLALYEINAETGRFRSFKTSKISDWLDYEKVFGVDYTRDGTIGEKVNDRSYGAGLYLGQYSRLLYWSPDEEIDGSAFSSSAIQLKATAGAIAALNTWMRTKPDDVKLFNRSVALGADGLPNDVQIVAPIYASVRQDRQLSALQVYEFDGQSGQFNSFVASHPLDVLAYERAFGEDFNLDTVVGDQAGVHFGAGLYLGTRNPPLSGQLVNPLRQALYWSPDPVDSGDRFGSEAIQLKAPVSVLGDLLKAKDDGIAVASSLVEMDADGLINDLQIVVPSYRRRNDQQELARLTVYDLNAAGRTKTFRTSAAVDVRRYEAIYQRDFDLDAITGDPVARAYGAGFYKVKSGSLYWSDQPQEVGLPIGTSATLIKASAGLIQGLDQAVDRITGFGLSDVGPVSRPIALDQGATPDGVQVVVPLYREVSVTQIDPVLRSLQVYEVNPISGALKSKSVSALKDVNALEAAFGLDFSLDNTLAGVDLFAF